MFNTEVRITWTDEDGNFGTASWADLSNKDIDQILFFTQRRLGQPASTT